MKDQLRIFAGNSNPSLADEICRYLDMPLSPIKISRFSNDNMHVQILENVRERDVFVIQSFTPPVNDHIVELFIILDALRSASARRITVVVPYYSYARSDKKDAPRISITGRLMADLMVTAGANRVLTMDLHAPQVQGFFSIPVDHLTAIPTIANHVQKQHDLSNAVVVAADIGSVKRAGLFAQRLDLPMAVIDKRRLSDTNVVQGSIVGAVEGCDAFVFEDEIATGTTLLTTVHTLQAAGVRKVFVGATHPIFCGQAIEHFAAAPIEAVFVTNTVDVPAQKRLDKITVLSVAPLFAAAIERIHTGESVGALFS